MDRRTFGLSALSVAALTAVTAAGCGGGGNPMEGGGSPGAAEPSTSGSGGGGGAVVVGSADFTESIVLAELYVAAMVAKGVDASTRLRIGAREVYLQAIRDGSIQVIPEYTGNLLQFLDEGNPAQQPEEIQTALEAAVGEGLKVLTASKATDQDVYVVTAETAQSQGIASLADLKKISADSVLGGPSELQERPYGPKGLESIYGATFKEFRPYNSPAVKIRDLNDDKVQVATFFTTEAAIAENNYVMLTDPEVMILPQNIVPLVADAVSENQAAVDAIEAVQNALTTEELTELNRKVDSDQADPKQVAQEYLQSKSLV